MKTRHLFFLAVAIIATALFPANVNAANASNENEEDKLDGSYRPLQWSPVSWTKPIQTISKHDLFSSTKLIHWYQEPIPYTARQFPFRR